MDNVVDRELSWDDEITKDSSDFILLPAGDYNFMVESYERARFAGSEKMPACNKAILKIRIDSADGAAFINHSLLLHSRTEWSLSEFFASIGQKKKGENLRMNWPMVPGSTGKCKVSIRNWNDRDGNERQSNEIKKFYPKEEKKYTAGDF